MRAHAAVLAACVLALCAALSACRRDATRVVSITTAAGGCLAAERGSARAGTLLVATTCADDPAQRFEPTAAGTLTQHGKCVDAESGKARPGDRLTLWYCNGEANQRWSMEPTRMTGIGGLCVALVPRPDSAPVAELARCDAATPRQRVRATPRR